MITLSHHWRGRRRVENELAGYRNPAALRRDAALKARPQRGSGSAGHDDIHARGSPHQRAGPHAPTCDRGPGRPLPHDRSSSTADIHRNPNERVCPAAMTWTSQQLLRRLRTPPRPGTAAAAEGRSRDPMGHVRGRACKEIKPSIPRPSSSVPASSDESVASPTMRSMPGTKRPPDYKRFRTHRRETPRPGQVRDERTPSSAGHCGEESAGV